MVAVPFDIVVSDLLKPRARINRDADVNIAVNKSNGVNIHIVNPNQTSVMFCCDLGITANETCWVPTRGSSAPFFIEAGLVIFNRTSGSTSPNVTNTVTATVTATRTTTTTTMATTLALASDYPSVNTSSLSSSSSLKRDVAIAAGMSAVLGVAFLVSLVLLWRLGKGKRSARIEAQTWEGKYWALFNTKASSALDGAGPQRVHQLDGWSSNELGGQSHLPHQLEGRQVVEIDGVQLGGVANMRR